MEDCGVTWFDRWLKVKDRGVDMVSKMVDCGVKGGRWVTLVGLLGIEKEQGGSIG